MRPVLFDIFGLNVPSYGVFAAIGFLASFVWAYFESRRVGVDTEKMLDLCIWIVIGAILGSRVLHVIVEWEVIRPDPLEAFRIWNGGLVLWGGAFGVILVTIVAVRIMRMPHARTYDIVAQSAAFGLIFGRVGCLFNGCCYGRPSDLPWAMTFTAKGSAAYLVKGIPLHPAQLYSVGVWILVFSLLVLLSRRSRFDGQVCWSFYILYPVGRFIVELYRGDPRGWVTNPYLTKAFAFLLQNQTYSDPRRVGFFKLPLLSASQFISIIVLTVAITGYLLTSRSAIKRQREGFG